MSAKEYYYDWISTIFIIIIILLFTSAFIQQLNI